MIARGDLTAEKLREMLHYDPETGVFSRAMRSGKCRAGEVASGTLSHGYLIMSVKSSLYAAHRLAWLWMTGEWPKNDIDHINGNRQDNRFQNLRDVNRGTNLQNMRVAKSNNKSTGLLGVHMSPITGRYTTRIQVRGVDKHLGSFVTPEAAHAAYINAKRQLHEGNML